MSPRSFESPSPNCTPTLPDGPPVVGVTVKMTPWPVVVVPVAFDVKLEMPGAFTVTVTSAHTAADFAVTFAVELVVSCAVATPFASVTVEVGETEPLSLVNVTGMPPSAPPPPSPTVAESCDEPPDDGSVCGVALIVMPLTAAVPMAICVFVVDAPPEYAVIVG